MCVIYRALNKVTASFEYSISRRDDAIDNLGDDLKPYSLSGLIVLKSITK